LWAGMIMERKTPPRGFAPDDALDKPDVSNASHSDKGRRLRLHRPDDGAILTPRPPGEQARAANSARPDLYDAGGTAPHDLTGLHFTGVSKDGGVYNRLTIPSISHGWSDTHAAIVGVIRNLWRIRQKRSIPRQGPLLLALDRRLRMTVMLERSRIAREKVLKVGISHWTKVGE
jgi:hypothetical protein